MNNCNICVFDLETGGVDPKSCTPLFVAAKMFHPRSLEPINGGEFKSLMRPKDNEWKTLDKKALEINKITEEQLKEAPERQVVWNSFCSFIDKFNSKPKNVWTAPIAGGMNIINYDLIIVDRLCSEIGRIDKEGKSDIFNRRFTYDLLHILGWWYENVSKPEKFNMDAVREHFGMPNTDAHGANMVDVNQEAELIIRFLKMKRKMFSRVPGLQGIHYDTSKKDS